MFWTVINLQMRSPKEQKQSGVYESNFENITDVF